MAQLVPLQLAPRHRPAARARPLRGVRALPVRERRVEQQCRGVLAPREAELVVEEQQLPARAQLRQRGVGAREGPQEERVGARAEHVVVLKCARLLLEH